MTEKEIKNTVKALNKFRKELLESPEKCKEFLFRLGFHTKTGRLKRKFK